MKTRILLTGATTLLGAEVLNELLRRADIETVVLISNNQEIGRLQAYLGRLPPHIISMRGDSCSQRFGLSKVEWDKVVTTVSLGFHCAQREINDQSLELARQENVRPMETWIEMLDRNPDLRLHHLSTAFVGGTRRGLFTEFDLNCGQGFNDAWERSKFEAEVRLRQSHVSERVTIYRPSHVLGREKTGQAFELGGAYPLLATIAGASILPGDRGARLDLVPADYVAAIMVALACSGAVGTFNLACGWEKSISVRRAVELVALARGGRRAGHLLPPSIAYPLRIAGIKALGRLASRSHAFAMARDRLHQGAVLDTYLADLALEPFKIAFPKPEQWLEKSVAYADTCCWESSITHQTSLGGLHPQSNNKRP